MKTIFANARIYLDDGVRGDVETKGDGLKRAVTFALLRTFVELRRMQRSLQRPGHANSGRYLFLFEEPELYLHPNAQRILYDALVEISAEHQVCVCTHSPYFFSATGSGTFLRLKKIDGDTGRPPISHALPVDLIEDISNKDAFQIICYENNSAAFFCDRVVLVEGDCDVIFLKHVARCLNPAWDFDRRNIAMIKIGGKGNFERYRDFFESFNVDVRVIADLDAVVDQFGKLGASSERGAGHSALLAAVDTAIAANGSGASITTDHCKNIAEKGTFRARYDRCKALAEHIAAGNTITVEELSDFSALFIGEHDLHRRHVLANDATIAPIKETLLAELRQEGIHVLSRGVIEDYYPDGVEGADKPSKALSACGKVLTPAAALGCCDSVLDGIGGSKPEFELLFENVFAGM